MPFDYAQAMQAFQGQFGDNPYAELESLGRDPGGVPMAQFDGSNIAETQAGNTGMFTATGGSIPAGWQEYLFPGGSKMVQQSGGYLNDPSHLATLMAIAVGGAAAGGEFGGTTAATEGSSVNLTGVGAGEGFGTGGDVITSSVSDLSSGMTVSPLGASDGALGATPLGALGGAGGGPSNAIAGGSMMDDGLGGGLDLNGLGPTGGDASLGGVSVTGGGTVGGGALDSGGGILSQLMSNLGNPSNILDLVKGFTGLAGANKLNNSPYPAMADPFASQRGQYQGPLSALMKNLGTTDLTKIPGYQAGLEAVQRSEAAQGFQNSGNMMAELAKYGGNFYEQNLHDQLAEAQLLGHFAGADVNPGTAAQIGQQGQTNAWNLGGQAINTIEKAVSPPLTSAASDLISQMNIWG